MPHIRALFIDTPETRSFLRANKTEIRTVVAEALGYPVADIAVIPEPISGDDLDLGDNLLPLELVINSGTRSIDREDECVAQIRQGVLARCDGAAGIQFGIWLRSHPYNAYIETEPASPH